MLDAVETARALEHWLDVSPAPESERRQQFAVDPRSRGCSATECARRRSTHAGPVYDNTAFDPEGLRQGRSHHVWQARNLTKEGDMETACLGRGERGCPSGRHRAVLPGDCLFAVPGPSGQSVPGQFKRCAHGVAACELNRFRDHRAQAKAGARERFLRGFHSAKRVQHTVQRIRGRQ